MTARDYIDVTYDLERLPLTEYPGKLARYLFDRYRMKPGQRLLDVGCGRGEFLRGFIGCGASGATKPRSVPTDSTG